MNQLNSILIEGNLVNDAEFTNTEMGTPFCKFCLASTRYTRTTDLDLERHLVGEKEVSFFDIETWKHVAMNCKANGKKGRGVRVVGRIKQERTAEMDGSEPTYKNRVIIVAEHVEFKPEFTRTKKAIKELKEAVGSLEKGRLDALDLYPHG